MKTILSCLTVLLMGSTSLLLAVEAQKAKPQARVTGIGGVFFKSDDPERLRNWYSRHLGVELENFGGAVFNWSDDHASDGGVTVWHVFNQDAEEFKPSEASFMINYRINDMAAMISQLQRAGVPILKGPESHGNGQFAWIMDPEGNKIELWEPKAWESKY